LHKLLLDLLMPFREHLSRMLHCSALKCSLKKPCNILPLILLAYLYLALDEDGTIKNILLNLRMCH